MYESRYESTNGVMPNTEHSILSDLEEEEEACRETFLVPALASTHPVGENISHHQLLFFIQFSPALPGPA